LRAKCSATLLPKVVVPVIVHCVGKPSASSRIVSAMVGPRPLSLTSKSMRVSSPLLPRQRPDALAARDHGEACDVLGRSGVPASGAGVRRRAPATRCELILDHEESFDLRDHGPPFGACAVRACAICEKRPAFNPLECAGSSRSSKSRSPRSSSSSKPVAAQQLGERRRVEARLKRLAGRGDAAAQLLE
jgi:hypothetical protein